MNIPCDRTPLPQEETMSTIPVKLGQRADIIFFNELEEMG